MDNLISISNVKENILDFEVDITNIETKDMCVYFVIEASEMDLKFECKRVENSKRSWTVIIPPLEMLETTTYNFHIDIIVDGYHFCPMNGNINVVGTHDVYVSRPKLVLNPSNVNKSINQAKEPIKTDNESIKEPIKKVKEPAKKVKEPVKKVKEPVKKVKEPVKKVKEPVKENSKSSSKDSKIREILSNLYDTPPSKLTEQENIDNKSITTVPFVKKGTTIH